MSSTVTVVTNERDFCADEVIAHLAELGAQVERINIEAATSRAVQTWSPSDEPHGTVVWWRQFEVDAVPHDLAEADEILVDRAQWRSWLSTIDVPGSQWVNPLWAARRAENKIEQLRVATSTGFDVPQTLVTNDRGRAAAFREITGDAVVKTLTSAFFAFSDRSFVFTESFDHPGLADADRWHGSPVMVQARIDAAADARVVSFGTHTFAAECTVPGLDWRKAPFDADQWQRCELPDPVARRCTEYRRTLGLQYAAFDFMVRDGTWWFLEANQAGEFSFIDRALGLGIANAFARHLIDLGRGCV